MPEFQVGDIVVEWRTRWSPVRGEVILTDSGLYPYRPIAVVWSYKGRAPFAEGWHHPGNLEVVTP